MLLSRVAESLYWINRYLERAENISRFVEVSEAMSLDCPPGSAEPWLPLIDASSDRETFDKLQRNVKERSIATHQEHLQVHLGWGEVNNI